MNTTTQNSTLAQRLEELVQSGVVTINPWSVNSFPTARIVVPVYDSNGTFMASPPANQMSPNEQLARHSERAE
ncbi:MAG: hypothetical protein HYS06_12230 [Methylocystis sp.]|nr:hypothetical protein [Methylocystis sp.]